MWWTEASCPSKAGAGAFRVPHERGWGVRILCECWRRQRKSSGRGEDAGPAGLSEGTEGLEEQAAIRLGQAGASGADIAERVRGSFQRQGFMKLLGAELAEVHPGFCEVHLAFRPEVAQQHGFFHGGVIGALCDNAGAYAAFSVAPPDSSGLTVEYKVNFIAPADGDWLIARARVVRPGRTLVVVSVEAFVVQGGREQLCATALETVMLLPGRPDAPAPEKQWPRPA